MQGKVLKRLALCADAVIVQYRHGASFEELAGPHGCAPGTIRRFLLSHDVPLRRTVRNRKLDEVGDEVVRAFLSGASIRHLADLNGVARSTVESYILQTLPAWIRDGAVTFATQPAHTAE